MRPQHKAAENRHVGQSRRGGGARASMRPQHKAAENRANTRNPRNDYRTASMRPQHKAAENPREFVSDVRIRTRFNEAAA